jgi:hypothetical protein
MQSLLACDANVLFNVMFLCRLPSDWGQLLLGKLAVAADLLQYTGPLLVAATTPGTAANALRSTTALSVVSAVQPARHHFSLPVAHFRFLLATLHIWSSLPGRC